MHPPEAKPPPPVSPPARPPRLSPSQAALAGACAVLWLRGDTHAVVWVVVLLALPAIRFALSSRYRRDTRAWLRERWGELDDYPVRRRRIPWTAVLVWVAVPEGLLCLSTNQTLNAGDTFPVLWTASSLVRHGRFDLDEWARPYGDDLPHFLTRTRSGVYSSYPSGMLVFALPVTSLARCVGADLTRNDVLDRLEKLTAACVAAVSLGLFFLVALHLVPPGPAWATALLLGSGSALFSTAGQALWQHGGIVLWCFVFLLVEFRGSPSWWATALQGMAFAGMMACRLSAAIFVAVLGLWVLLRCPRRAVLLAVFSAVAFAPWALLHTAVYGTPLGPASDQMGASDWPGPSANSVGGVLVSPGRGLVIYQPWVILLAAPLFPGVRRRMAEFQRAGGPAGWVWVCVSIVVLHVTLVASWRAWWGGYCWGSRLLAEVVPLCGLLCVKPVAALWPAPGGRRLVLALAVVGFLMHAPAVYFRADNWNAAFEGKSDVDRDPGRNWDWSDPPVLWHLLHYRVWIKEWKDRP